MKNEELRKLALMADAPSDVMNQEWFYDFCLKFVDLIAFEVQHDGGFERRMADARYFRKHNMD